MAISEKLIPTERDLDIVYTTKQLAERVDSLASQITADYARAHVNKIYVVQILHGAQFFCGSLMRAIRYQSDTNLRMQLDSIILSSYKETGSTGNVQIQLDLGHSVKDLHVLLVEDIVDTGLTIATARNLIEQKEPASLRVCSLLDKPSKRLSEYQTVRIDYKGFTIKDIFVVGYGLDFEGYFRELPHIAKLKQNFIRILKKRRPDGQLQPPRA